MDIVNKERYPCNHDERKLGIKSRVYATQEDVDVQENERTIE